MKVILTKDVQGLGRSGDVKEVSDGHARNFLVPKHFALPATTQALAKLQKEEQEHQSKVTKQQEWFEALKVKLESKTFTIKAKASKEHLFAAVHEKEILEALNLPEAKVILDKPIKTLGLHKIEIWLDPKYSVKINLNVQSI